MASIPPTPAAPPASPFGPRFRAIARFVIIFNCIAICLACILDIAACNTIASAPAGTSAAAVVTPPPTTFSAALNSSSDFIGASIIQYWPMPLHNDGIAGQTSAQVLARFSTAVLNHGYARVIILCGTNDILDNVPNLPTELTANLQAMAQIASSAGIEVVLSELPPITNNTTQNAGVDLVNPAIIQLAAQNGYLLVDFNTPLQGHPEDFIDGIHPNAAGYAVMEAALSAVVTH